MTGSLESLRGYLETYFKILWDDVEEAYKHRPEEIGVLFEVLNNWIDMFPMDDSFYEELTNSVIGVLFFYSWKTLIWVVFEILCGRYFEAMRNLRFIFEGVIRGAVIEKIIDDEVCRRFGAPGSFSLKADIFELIEKCRYYRVRGRGGRINIDAVRHIVDKYINASSLPSDKKTKYRDMYTAILSRKEIHQGVSSMLRICCKMLEIPEEYDNLVELWNTLSRYHHFTNIFLWNTLFNPDIIFVETFDADLFDQSYHALILVSDLALAVLSWRFPRLADKINKICELWEKKLGLPLKLTKKVLIKVEKT